LLRQGLNYVREARAVALKPIDRIELVANGRIVSRVAADKARFTINPRQYSWYAVGCFLKTPMIYLNGHCDRRADAAYFVTWMDGLMERTIQDTKRFRNDEKCNEAMRNYREARTSYQSKDSVRSK
jgi:hypothetical protein